MSMKQKTQLQEYDVVPSAARQVPPGGVQWGNIVIVFVFLGLLMACSLPFFMVVDAAVFAEEISCCCVQGYFFLLPLLSFTFQRLSLAARRVSAFIVLVMKSSSGSQAMSTCTRPRMQALWLAGGHDVPRPGADSAR
jgi:hypothetical protein